MVKRHTRPQQVPGAQSDAAARRRDRARGPDPRLERDARSTAKASRTRVGIEREDGQRFRVASSTGARLD